MSESKGAVCPNHKLILSISGPFNRIRIGWGVADILKDAQFLSIYMSPENDAIMVRPCEEKEFLSIKVVQHEKNSIRKELRLYSQAFITDLMDKNGWDYTKSYHISGEYVEKYNAVVFKLKNAKLDNV